MYYVVLLFGFVWLDTGPKITIENYKYFADSRTVCTLEPFMDWMMRVLSLIKPERYNNDFYAISTRISHKSVFLLKLCKNIRASRVKNTLGPLPPIEELQTAS